MCSESENLLLYLVQSTHEKTFFFSFSLSLVPDLLSLSEKESTEWRHEHPFTVKLFNTNDRVPLNQFNHPMIKEWETPKRFMINFPLSIGQVIGTKVKAIGINLFWQKKSFFQYKNQEFVTKSLFLQCIIR